jgi:7-carboxy-7-deazaguanine synthase
MSSLVINEIFHSIQGESSHIGKPCVFVRLTYCNLRCSYCDTAYAFYEGKKMTPAEILAAVDAYSCRLVEVTGGEPLLQDGVYDLMTELCDRGHETLLETGGSIDISRVDPRVHRIVDFKCPSSGMVEKNLWTNVRRLTPNDEVKYVIGTREDFEWAVEMIATHEIDRKCPVLMSVVFGVLPPIDLAQWILERGLNVRLQMQLHKYIWEPEMRGV